MAFSKVILKCLCVVYLSGCVIAPVIDAYSQIGLSRADRERMLQKNIKSFNENLYWGKPMEAMTFVKDSERTSVAKELKGLTDGVRIVESKVEGIEFDEDAHKADVTVLVKYFKVPFFVVLDRKELQSWEFSFSDGWKFVALKKAES